MGLLGKRLLMGSATDALVISRGRFVDNFGKFGGGDISREDYGLWGVMRGIFGVRVLVLRSLGVGDDIR